MRALLRSTIFIAAFAAATGACAGQWGTTCGTMSLPDEPADTAIHSAYSVDQGRVIGQMRVSGGKAVISGIWVEADSGKTCDSEEDGSLHWGRVTLRFNADYTSFSGSWTYCDGNSGGSWNGTLGASKGHGVNK